MYVLLKYLVLTTLYFKLEFAASPVRKQSPLWKDFDSCFVEFEWTLTFLISSTKCVSRLQSADENKFGTSADCIFYHIVVTTMYKIVYFVESFSIV